MLILKIIVSNVLYCCTVNLSRHNYFLANKNLLFYQCLFVYIIKRTFHGGLRIWILFSRGKNNILLTRGALSYNIVLPLENKIHIFAPPCNILYIYALNGESYWTAGACLAVQHFIHTNRPYNFANILSPSSTHEIQPNWAHPSVLPNSHCFDNLDRVRLTWSTAFSLAPQYSFLQSDQWFQNRMRIIHRNLPFFDDGDS